MLISMLDHKTIMNEARAKATAAANRETETDGWDYVAIELSAGRWVVEVYDADGHWLGHL